MRIRDATRLWRRRAELVAFASNTANPSIRCHANPAASTQKLNCYIVDQAADPTNGLHQPACLRYGRGQLQCGRRLNSSRQANQVTTLARADRPSSPRSRCGRVSGLPATLPLRSKWAILMRLAGPQQLSAITVKTPVPIWQPVSTPSTTPGSTHHRRRWACPSASLGIAPAKVLLDQLPGRARPAARPVPSACPSGRRGTATWQPASPSAAGSARWRWAWMWAATARWIGRTPAPPPRVSTASLTTGNLGNGNEHGLASRARWIFPSASTWRRSPR